MSDMTDDELLAALGVAPKEKQQRRFSPEEERVWAGFEEICRFYRRHGRAPRRDAADIFARIYAARLAALKRSERRRGFLAEFDKYGLLSGGAAETEQAAEDLSDDALLSELGADFGQTSGLTNLVHVRPYEERTAETAETIAERSPCADFAKFAPLFAQIQEDLRRGARKTLRFEKTAIEEKAFFILNGQMLYVAEKGELMDSRGKGEQARLRVIYDNGTESNILLRSLQRALYKDETGRRITEPPAGPLFGSEVSAGDVEGGVIYVLESLSPLPQIAAQRGLLHKIGVTGGDVKKRIANAAKDSTFLLADVKIVREYALYNIKRRALEALIHSFFSAAQADIRLRDRFNNPIQPKEWFFVPLPAIDEAVACIKDGTITRFSYDAAEAKLVKLAE